MTAHVPGSAATSRAIASTPYDTAWLATVTDPRERRDPRFPSALTWILSNQLPDGSWGSAIPYKHDRIISTLAALIPLAQFGRRESDREQLRRGERYLWQHAHFLGRIPCELVGFELLLPTLMQRAAEAGIRVPPFLDRFKAEREAKLAMLPPHLLYSRNITIAHSLEFLGADVNPAQLLLARAANGSIGNSPAATAFLLEHVDDAAAVAYLERCLAGDGGFGVPVLEPCETFEAMWVAYHRFLGGAPAADLLPEPLRTELRVALAGAGVSLSPSFPIPDADDTAVALMLFHDAGIAVDPAALQNFERADYFVSFPYERTPSTGVNIHVLQALIRCATYPERDGAIAKIIRFLDGAREYGTYWTDKWHISPYYATSHAIAAFRELPQQWQAAVQPLVATAIDWMLQTQNADGSWGFYGTPTVEETAYTVLGLRAWAGHSAAVDAALTAGHAYLWAHQADDRPAMWLDKCLYYPPRIVDAAVVAALAAPTPS